MHIVNNKLPVIHNACLAIGVMVALASMGAIPLEAQFLDRMRNPKVPVLLKHPPRLGLNVSKIAFAPVTGECAEQIIDRLSGILVNRGIEVMERQNLQLVLNEQNLGQSGLMNRETAVRMGELLGPTLLVILKAPTCRVEQRRNYSDRRTSQRIIRTHNAISEGFVRGSMQTVDLATGRIFSASPLEITLPVTNSSDQGIPEFPSTQLIMDRVIESAAQEASRYYVDWREQRTVYFYNDKECNLIAAYAALKNHNYAEVVRQSEENVATCSSSSNVKQDKRANAFYNAGIAYLLINEHAKALSYLTQAAGLRDTAITREAIAEASRSAGLAAASQRVVEQTERFEQALSAGRSVSNQGVQQVPGKAPAGKATADLEDRLRKLEGLFKQGVITKEEYEAKKTELLKEL